MDDDLWFWKVTALLNGGHVSYRSPQQLAKEGPFTNPARMVEDIMGANPTKGDGRFDGRSDSDQQANIWRLAGWWD
jgi:hypothetical protein